MIIIRSLAIAIGDNCFLLQQYEAAQLMAIFPDYRPQETNNCR
ncbi:hypothetical protein [Microcystis panniformis]|uniref:Uncharacterized protein n=1 Tax=Microcystis panniformis FACHB-1757 TaxID=1638788 RepID=A0A0K1S330_9CHRO|nr:hypothetical protein [Microcystis panniformis]AKV68381.1 hypothetical protein VL20_3374 [Microcystis panniformis FACHB-1757]